jgi:hypothetical protein
MSKPEERIARVRPTPPTPAPSDKPDPVPAPAAAGRPPAQKDEVGGPTGPEPTRYGDWERGGRCTDF